MAIKKVAFEFNPFKETGIKVPKDKKEEAQSRIQDFVKEQVLSYVGEGKSPVQGGPWKRSLSPEYKKEKSKVSSATFANLELSGDTLDSLDVRAVNSETISLEIANKAQAGIAEGNNIGSYGGAPDESKARRFIPLKGETFKKPIIDGIKKILRDYGDED